MRLYCMHTTCHAHQAYVIMQIYTSQYVQCTCYGDVVMWESKPRAHAHDVHIKIPSKKRIIRHHGTNTYIGIEVNTIKIRRAHLGQDAPLLYFHAICRALCEGPGHGRWETGQIHGCPPQLSAYKGFFSIQDLCRFNPAYDSRYKVFNLFKEFEIYKDQLFSPDRLCGIDS